MYMGYPFNNFKKLNMTFRPAKHNRSKKKKIFILVLPSFIMGVNGTSDFEDQKAHPSIIKVIHYSL